VPAPERGEKLGSYLQRFMGSPEARKDFPKQKQRAAVAYSMFKRRKKRA
jgi:hypothetical protein